jgi:hypothetical protein
VFDSRASYASHAPETISWNHRTSYGTSDFARSGYLAGAESFITREGRMYLADFNAYGPYGPYTPNAFVRLQHGPASGTWNQWFESHAEIFSHWYGDIGLASTGDGGAVLFWSQLIERRGLFARRFGSAGQTTAAPAADVRTIAGSMRFELGRGVLANVTYSARLGRVDLFDVQGRLLATARIGAISDAAEITLPGTAQLPVGLYLGRYSSQSSSWVRRVIVAR